MFYIKEITVSGLNGRDELKLSFNPLTNVIRGEKESDASSILLLLQAAVNGATEGLEDIHFDSAVVAMALGKRGPVHWHSIRKKDAASHERSRDWSWCIEPEIPDEDRSMWKCIYLPGARDYTTRERLPVAPLFEGDLPGESRSDSLYKLWNEFWLKATRKCKKLFDDPVVLKSLFSKPQSRKKAKRPGSPQSDYIRVKSYLGRFGLEDSILSFKSFKEALKSDEGLKRAVSAIAPIEDEIDKTTGKFERLEELASQMIGPGKNITIDVHGFGVRSDSDETLNPTDLSAPEKGALMLLLAAAHAEDAVLLIDGVDASLDDDLLKVAPGNMRRLNADGQFILTCNNLKLMDHVDDASRLWL